MSRCPFLKTTVPGLWSEKAFLSVCLFLFFKDMQNDTFAFFLKRIFLPFFWIAKPYFSVWTILAEVLRWVEKLSNFSPSLPTFCFVLNHSHFVRHWQCLDLVVLLFWACPAPCSGNKDGVPRWALKNTISRPPHSWRLLFMEPGKWMGISVQTFQHAPAAMHKRGWFAANFHLFSKSYLPCQKLGRMLWWHSRGEEMTISESIYICVCVFLNL